MNLSFKGKTVVVSGAAIGFGRAIAESFASLGASVHGCDILEKELAAIAKAGVADATCRPHGPRRRGRVDQGGREESRRRRRHSRQQRGRCRRTGPKPLEEVSDADWDKIIAVNLGAAFALSRAAAPAMKKAKQGRIINISSGAGLQASLTGIQAYCSAKHARRRLDAPARP